MRASWSSTPWTHAYGSGFEPVRMPAMSCWQYAGTSRRGHAGRWVGPSGCWMGIHREELTEDRKGGSLFQVTLDVQGGFTGESKRALGSLDGECLGSTQKKAG